MGSNIGGPEALIWLAFLGLPVLAVVRLAGGVRRGSSRRRG